MKLFSISHLLCSKVLWIFGSSSKPDPNIILMQSDGLLMSLKKNIIYIFKKYLFSTPIIKRKNNEKRTIINSWDFHYLLTKFIPFKTFKDPFLSMNGLFLDFLLVLLTISKQAKFPEGSFFSWRTRERFFFWGRVRIRLKIHPDPKPWF